MPSVDVGSASLFYEERGSGDPVVFVHGIPTDYRAWSAQMEPLSKRFRTISLSRRCASPNEKRGDVGDSTVGNNAADLKGFIEKMGIAPANVVAHSYGGFVGAYMTADHPDLVRSLVLVEPAVSTLLVANQKSSAQLLSLLLRSPSVALAARRF
jgi:pimeloyl-ACP methyl ester carboxylesterase